MSNNKVVRINNEVYFFEEQECIHLKAINPSNAKGDPAELTSDEAIKLANQLLEMAKIIKEKEEVH